MSENPKPAPTSPVPPPTAAKKARDRSPGYPAFSLRKALEYAKKIWDADKRQPAMVARAITNLGFSAKSSGGAIALATMKKYALLDAEGLGEAGKVKLSDSAISLLNPSFADREKLLKTLALRPSIHAELWAKYGADLPSDGTIRDYLVFDRHFFDEAVAILIPSYKDTIAFANLTDADKVREQPSDDPNPAAEHDQTPRKAHTTPKSNTPAAYGHPAQKPPFPAGVPQPPQMSDTSQALIDIPVPLPSGILAYYRVPQKMTDSDFNFYGALLTAYKPGLVGVAQNQEVKPKFPVKAIWHNKDSDKEVVIVGFMGQKDGEGYFRSEDGTGIRADELTMPLD